MPSDLHPLWESPPSEASELKRQAHRLMLQLLMKIRKRAENILIDPISATGARVMDAAISASLNPKIDSDLRLAALTLLQKKMASVDPSTPKRLFLAYHAQQHAIAPTFGTDLHDLSIFEEGLARYILANPPNVAVPAHDERECLLRVGLLLALLVTRTGQASVPVLAAVVRNLNRKPFVGSQWAWIDLPVSPSSYGSMETRRAFLDPNTLAAWLFAAGSRTLLPAAPKDARPSKVTGHSRKLANAAFRVLLDELKHADCESHIVSLKRLCHCQAQRLCLTTVPLIASYATGHIVSSSLEASTWMRLIGCQIPDEAESLHSSTPPPAELQNLREEKGLTEFADQLAAGDLEESGPVAELRHAMSLNRPQWKEALDSLIRDLETDPSGKTAALVVRWMRYLSEEYRYKGKQLTDGTLRYYRGLLVNRLLSHLPQTLAGIGSTELEDAYVDLISTRRSAQQGSRMRVALSAFDRFARERYLPDLPKVALPGFEIGGAYTISTRIITPEEYEAGLRAIDDGTLAFAPEEQCDQTRVFWILGFRFGLRRSEILGCQTRDFTDSILLVRRNEVRTLKTLNAVRLIPLQALPKDEREAILKLVASCRCDGRSFPFFAGTPGTKDLESHAVIAKINSLLWRVTGDERLHPHNLRHSAGSLILLGMLGADLGVHDHPAAELWMKTCQSYAKQLEHHISGALHAKAARGSALSMLLGHGSELSSLEHYIHTLDILLFLTAWSGRYEGQACGAVDFPARREGTQIRAMLGRSITTRVETKDLAGLMARVASLSPAGVRMLEPAKPLPSTHETPEFSANSDITLGKLLCYDPTSPGWPKNNQARRDTAAKVLSAINSGYRRDPEAVRTVVGMWCRARLKNDDWASMTPAEAMEFASQVGAVLPQLPVEYLHVYMLQGLRKTKKFHIGPDKLGQVEAGKIWIRLPDPRLDVASAQRMKLQSTVTWILFAIAHFLV